MQDLAMPVLGSPEADLLHGLGDGRSLSWEVNRGGTRDTGQGCSISAPISCRA